MMQLNIEKPSLNEEVVKKDKKDTFRGYIHSTREKAVYYIVNELVNGEYTKVFSAVKFTIKDKEKTLDENRYCIRYLSKEWIKKEVFAKLQIHEERIKKFFDSLKKSFELFRKITHSNIQELKDYIDDEDGIYIVVEFCDYTLKDYIQILREPVRNSRFPFEIKVRKIIIQILETLHHIQDGASLSLGGVLNSNDIMVTEFLDSTNVQDVSNMVLVKFPHPFLAHLLSILKIYNVEKFPSYYAPEVYKLFESKEVEKVIEKKDSFDLSSLLSKINQNMDMWSLGYLLYEILFDDPPFVFDDMNSAIKSLDKNFNYKMHPYVISPVCLKMINMCLQLEPQDRLQTFLLYELKNELKKDNENLEDLEKYMRNRMKDKNPKDEFENFNLTSLIYDHFV